VLVGIKNNINGLFGLAEKKLD